MGIASRPMVVPITKVLSTPRDRRVAFRQICGTQNEYIPNSVTGASEGTITSWKAMKTRRPMTSPEISRARANTYTLFWDEKRVPPARQTAETAVPQPQRHLLPPTRCPLPAQERPEVWE